MTVLLLGLTGCTEAEPETPSDAPGEIELAEPGPAREVHTPPLSRCAARRSMPFSIVAIDDATDDIVRFDVSADAELEVIVRADRDASESERIDTPYDVAASMDGDIFVANFGTGSVVRYDHRGSLEDVVYFDRAVLEEPSALRLVSDVLWVVGNDSRNLVGLDPHDGELLEAVAGDGSIPWPLTLALDPSGEYAFVTATSGEVGKQIQIWSLESGQRVGSFGGSELDHLLGIEVGCRGGVYVSTTDAVVRYRPSSVDRGTPIGPFEVERVLPLDGARRLKMGPDGNIYVTAEAGLFRLNDEATRFEPVHAPTGLALRSFDFVLR